METKTEELQLKMPWGFVAAKTWGSPRNYPVLVIHGIMDNAGSFDRLISQLPIKRFYYVAIDLPGHGLSSHFPSGLPLEFFNYIFCIKLVLEELGWKSCVAIAHSLGALLIHFFTYLCPGIIKKYVSIDLAVTRNYDGDEIKSRFLQVYKSALEYENKEDFRLYSKEEIIYALQARRMHYLKKEAAEAMFERSVTEVDGQYKYNRDSRLKIFLRPVFNYNQILEYLSKETVPTLFIVASTMSKSLEVNGLRTRVLEIAKGKKLVEYVVVEGNHDLHTNHPEKLVPLIEKFLEQIISKL